jgi:hypothetical protein
LHVFTVFYLQNLVGCIKNGLTTIGYWKPPERQQLILNSQGTLIVKPCGQTTGFEIHLYNQELSHELIMITQGSHDRITTSARRTKPTGFVLDTRLTAD